MPAALSAGPSVEDIDVVRNRRYLELFPTLRQQLQFRFRFLSFEKREEAIQEAACNSFVTLHRLFQKGEESKLFASPLARYAVAQFHSGRRVGQPRNCQDLYGMEGRSSADDSRFSHRILRDEEGHCGIALVEDHRAGPAETAAIRIDFQNWMDSLPPQHRDVALFLATGESTRDAAIRFAVTPSRISQIRKQLSDSWTRFQGDDLHDT